MVSGSLRDRKKAKTRSDIVWSATRLFEELGYDATSIDRVAQEANISRGTLFNYFANKEALLNAIGEQEVDDLRMALERDSTEIASPVKRLERLIGTTSRDTLHYKNVSRLFLQSLLSQPSSMPSAVSAFVGIIRDQVVEAQQAGEIDPHVDPTELMVGFMGLYAAWLFWAFLEDDPMSDHQNRFWSLLDMFFEGIAGPAFASGGE